MVLLHAMERAQPPVGGNPPVLEEQRPQLGNREEAVVRTGDDVIAVGHGEDIERAVVLQVTPRRMRYEHECT